MVVDRDNQLWELRKTLVAYLYDMHPNDPNVALWYGSVTYNADIIEKSLSSGADRNVKDTAIILSHQDTLLQSAEMSKKLIEWLRITSPALSDRDKRLLDLRYALFTYLYSVHPNDPNVACWYGVVTNNTDIVDKSLSSGADVNARDVAVMWPLRYALLQSEIADKFIEWFLEMTNEEKPRFKPLFTAFKLAIESPYCTLLPKIGDELIREADPETAKAVHFAIATTLLERTVGDPADNIDNVIRHYLALLPMLSPDRDTTMWWQAHANLATAYGRCKRGDLADLRDKAVQHYEKALQVLPTDDPNWGALANNLAAARRRSF